LNSAPEDQLAWIESAPDHWEHWKLGHLAKVGNGSTPNRDTDEYWRDGAIPWLNSSVVNEAEVTKAEQFVTELAWRECHLPLVPAGSVLVGITGQGKTRGRATVLSFQATVNQHVAYITPDKQKVDPWFLRWLLNAGYDFLRSISDDAGGTKGALICEDLSNLRLPLPPLPAQRAITTFLGRETARLDALVAAKERVLGLLAEKRRALITRAPLRASGIPWLGEIPAHWETERTRWLFRERDERSESGEEELLTVSHLTGVTPRSEKDVNMFEAETTEGYKICYAGDLVINTLWAWMGAMGVSRVNGIVSPAYNVYRPGPRLDPSFVDALVRMPVFAQEVTRYSKGVWSSRLRLYPEGFFEVFFPVPPTEEQRAIVARIAAETAKVDAMRSATERTITLLKERRAALIVAAVTGTIDVGAAAA
jgi:type I restriction enzyme S subunit